ncbi:unnamed protein product [Durusdinium trenchii]|uniref:Tudor domain-containing protein n=1 Tax=Durusdinium trenchii TaxID=1381693 RepID=A0ABP0KGM5_9DINO
MSARSMTSADANLRWGRPKNASAPPWRPAAEDPPWRRLKETRSETQVSMQQGGSSASDCRRSPSKDQPAQAAQAEARNKPEKPEEKSPRGEESLPGRPEERLPEKLEEKPPERLESTAKAPTAEASREFEIGEKVRYWSGTHAKWVEAHVQRINKGPEGDLISYDLTAKAQADISRVKDASTAEDAPPPVAPARVAPHESADGKAADQVPELQFDKGVEVQYFSETRKGWIDAVVEERHDKEGAVIYDLNCKKGVPADRLRNPHVEYAVGEQVEYWSVTSQRWMPAIVEHLHAEAKTCDLSVKPGAPLSRVRKVPGSATMAPIFKGVRATISHGVGVPPPPLACSFKGGDQVQYYSETKQRWMETTVIRIYEQEGNICYDLDCKKGVFADKVRSSLRASQERYEVGESVEYWSVSAGRWLSAKVTRVRLDLGQCDLDIKFWA